MAAAQERWDYFDKKGEQITPETWIHLIKDENYKRVAETTLPDGKWVSTVWLGLNHNFRTDNAPLIFETMVFLKREDWYDVDMERYTTEEEAICGHKRMLTKYLRAVWDYRTGAKGGIV